MCHPDLSRWWKKEHLDMMKYDRNVLGKQARELGFVRDTFEKVCRLTDILRFVENDPDIPGRKRTGR